MNKLNENQVLRAAMLANEMNLTEEAAVALPAIIRIVAKGADMDTHQAIDAITSNRELGEWVIESCVKVGEEYANIK